MNKVLVVQKYRFQKLHLQNETTPTATLICLRPLTCSTNL
ncbi:hypothetical protein GBAR_LOCUS8435 [Geodia barretti]|uniref:Uncharacterized protein n=1 Tax=Geodia barretti TaxID=519541 RepID=A0AA35RKM2_GEOBA|nr:hypothetical protein GBAR_LOCUS8435 [Geodia barretti]